LLDGKTSVPTYRPAKPETIERSSNVTTKSAVVRLGKRPVIQGHLAAKARSSERIAANSKTRERYESEITIAIHARGREAGNTDLMPIAAAIEVMARRTKSFLVSLLTVEFTIAPEWLP
jgi:predicted subunit of tRNA(5-methylaminomethyl-2-thiouridylate) methyltransferase